MKCCPQECSAIEIQHENMFSKGRAKGTRNFIFLSLFFLFVSTLLLQLLLLQDVTTPLMVDPRCMFLEICLKFSFRVSPTDLGIKPLLETNLIEMRCLYTLQSSSVPPLQLHLQVCVRFSDAAEWNRVMALQGEGCKTRKWQLFTCVIFFFFCTECGFCAVGTFTVYN